MPSHPDPQKYEAVCAAGMSGSDIVMRAEWKSLRLFGLHGVVARTLSRRYQYLWPQSRDSQKRVNISTFRRAKSMREGIGVYASNCTCKCTTYVQLRSANLFEKIRSVGWCCSKTSQMISNQLE